MNPGREDSQEILRQVVRGERPWTDLGVVGIHVRREGDRHILENPQHISACVGVQDLARGFRTYLPDVHALREWAFLVEAMDVDLGEVECHPEGETLLEALWDASFGEPVSTKALRAIEQLA
jgi:hypothetical protein